MTRQTKIDFLVKRLGDRFTKEHLETKSDFFIDHLYFIECQVEDSQLEAMIANAF